MNVVVLLTVNILEVENNADSVIVVCSFLIYIAYFAVLVLQLHVIDHCSGLW